MSEPAAQQDVDRQPLPLDLSRVSAHGLRRPFLLTPPLHLPTRAAVLLVHGFTGTPFEMRLLGERLAQRGYLAYGPRLFGHGETTSALARSTSRDWVQTVDDAFEFCKTQHERVCVVGLSLGGLLALDLGKRRGAEIVAIASLSAPLWLSRPVEAIIAITRRLGLRPTFVVPKGAGSDISEPSMRLRNNLAQGAIGIPVPAVLSLHAFMRHVREELPRVRIPTLAAHSRRDHTAPYACLATLAKEVGTRDVETLTLERSYHVITLDWEREIVARAVDNHFARYLARAD